jgi:hypothetical protein
VDFGFRIADWSKKRRKWLISRIFAGRFLHAGRSDAIMRLTLAAGSPQNEPATVEALNLLTKEFLP